MSVYIPPYVTPVGTRISLHDRQGVLTWEKQEDGGWEVVDFEGSK
jgi:hypothetical protein